MIVVDASLATKWHLTEPDSVAALKFLDRYEDRLCGPDLLAIEVCRALVTAANACRIDRPAATNAITNWLAAIEEGEISLLALDVRLIRRGTEIALDLGHPLSDCLYLALAMDIGADLATCDAKFMAKGRNVYPNIQLLADHG